MSSSKSRPTNDSKKGGQQEDEEGPSSSNLNPKKKNNKKKKGNNTESQPGETEEGRDFGEKNKRRNSLTDSPLTELSPSSTTSNGDSADDIEAGSNSKQGSSCTSSQSLSNEGTYVVNPPQSNKEISNIIKFPFLSDITAEEKVDEVERDYVEGLWMAQKKHLIKQLKYNQWTEQLCQTILSGDFFNFYRRFKMVMICLRKRRPKIYAKLTDMQLASHIAQLIVERFYNQEEKATILMILLTNGDRNVTCADRAHGFCRIAHLLLKLLDRKELQKLLEVTTEKSGKTALHLAIATGESCQVQVLLALAEIDANRIDRSGRAALHYAIERNNLDMVRMLMWYGADISFCYSENPNYDPLQLSLCADPNSTVQYWLSNRVNAISHRMQSLVRHLCAQVFCVKKELSPVHFVRFGSCWALRNHNLQFDRECQLNLRTTNSSSNLEQMLRQNPKSKIILFMIPVSFRTTDQKSAATDPQLVRVEFPDNSHLLSTMIVLESKSAAIQLNSIFHQRHNGCFYAYELSTSTPEGLHKLIFSIKSTTGFSEDSRNVLLAVQAYLCIELDKSKSKLE